MSDLFSSTSDVSSSLDGSKGEKEIQEFLLVEREKARLQAQVNEFVDICWEKCVDKPTNKLDSKTSTCMLNCVDRFIDVSLLITNRFAQMLQKSTGY